MRLVVLFVVAALLAFVTLFFGNIASTTYLSFLSGVSAKDKGFLTLFLIILSVVVLLVAKTINARRREN